MVSKLIYLVEGISGWSGKIGSWLIVPISLFTLLEVVLRYFFNSPTNWASEATGYLFGIMCFLAGGYCLRHGMHVKMEIITGMLSQRRRAVLDLITSIFTYLFLIMLLWRGYLFALEATVAFERSGTEWNPPYWPFVWFLPIGAFLLLLQELSHLASNLICIAKKERP
jgi:TRAP-type mannitol/chloroaromatic compound transport system permease small subunit